MYYLGYDGGGSKCAFVIADENGCVLSSVILKRSDYTKEPCTVYYPFAKMLADGTELVCKEAGIQISDLSRACLTITGYGELSTHDEIFEAAVREIFGDVPVDCCHDSVGGWAGSLACCPGINLIAGTGSVAYGRTAKEDGCRAGGWGFFCGDEGSGYWLGRKLLSLFTKEADGRLPRGRIYEIIRASFQVTSDFDFRYGAAAALENDRAGVAMLQKLLLQAAQEGDPRAINLYQEAAGELALLVESLVQRLPFPSGEPIRVSYGGGVFQAGEFLLAPLRKRLADCGAELVPPLLSPVLGAVLLAITGGEAVPSADSDVTRRLVAWERANA